MADFYGQMATIADNLLTRFNQATITLVRVGAVTGPSYAPGKPVETLEMMTGAVARGVSTKYIVNGLANAGDLEVTIKARNVTAPSLSDAVLINDVRYKIVSVETIPAAATPIVYKLVVRRG